MYVYIYKYIYIYRERDMHRNNDTMHMLSTLSFLIAIFTMSNTSIYFHTIKSFFAF